MERLTDGVCYVGVNDHQVDLFEGQYIVPNGMAYNSYVILDDAAAVIDTVDKSKTEEWLGQVEQALSGRCPDYLVVQHMEPDHSASIEAFVKKYPSVTLVGNAMTFLMIGQFFPGMTVEHKQVVKDGDVLSLGGHALQFVFAPMVHWPEVMMSYEKTEKILFSADGFGKFGALDVQEEWACEARRYYFGIVGKYGAQVQNVLKKAAGLEIRMICPLHGPVLKEDIGYYLNLYDIWSSYRPEAEGICICYTSVYGHTKEAVDLLQEELHRAGAGKVSCFDLARCDMAEAVEDAFKYDRLVLATTTYNTDIFPFMKTFLHHLLERGYQKRTVALIENGTWAPAAAKGMREMLKNARELTVLEPQITIRSALSQENREQLAQLALRLTTPGC